MGARLDTQAEGYRSIRIDRRDDLISNNLSINIPYLFYYMRCDNTHKYLGAYKFSRTIYCFTLYNLLFMYLFCLFKISSTLIAFNQRSSEKLTDSRANYIIINIIPIYNIVILSRV